MGSIKVKLTPHSVKQDYYYPSSLSYAVGNYGHGIILEQLH